MYSAFRYRKAATLRAALAASLVSQGRQGTDQVPVQGDQEPGTGQVQDQAEQGTEGQNSGQSQQQ